MRDLNRGTRYSLQFFANQISPHSRAITFSGGEPLFQREALTDLLGLLPDSSDIMLYTGLQTERFLVEYQELLPTIDLCVTEPYEVQQHGNFLWRGSANQRILSPSGRYRDEVIHWEAQPSNGIEVVMKEGEYFIYGIPPPGTLEKLKKVFNDHKIITKNHERVTPTFKAIDRDDR